MGGRSSVVERQLPKLNVVGSIPIARSILFNSLELLADITGTRDTSGRYWLMTYADSPGPF